MKITEVCRDTVAFQGREHLKNYELPQFSAYRAPYYKERVKAGIIKARSKGKAHGRPKTAVNNKEEIRKLFDNGKGLSKSEIARKLKIGRTSVIRLLNENLAS